MADPKAYPQITVTLDNGSNVPTDISAYIDAAKGVIIETETKRYTYIPMSTGIEVEIPGAQKKTINLDCFDTPESQTFFDSIFRLSGLHMVIYPDGPGSGERMLSMTVTCTHKGEPGFFDGIYKFPVALSIQTGPVETTV